jgi:hypothetical protein
VRGADSSSTAIRPRSTRSASLVALLVCAQRGAQPDLDRLRVLAALRVRLAELLERAAVVRLASTTRRRCAIALSRLP